MNRFVQFVIVFRFTSNGSRGVRFRLLWLSRVHARQIVARQIVARRVVARQVVARRVVLQQGGFLRRRIFRDLRGRLVFGGLVRRHRVCGLDAFGGGVIVGRFWRFFGGLHDLLGQTDPSVLLGRDLLVLNIALVVAPQNRFGAWGRRIDIRLVVGRVGDIL